MRKLNPKAFRAGDEAFWFQRYFVQLEKGDRFADLFVPSFWSHHSMRLNERDIIRVQSYDKTWTVEVTVAEKVTGGLVVVRCDDQVPTTEQLADAKEVNRATRYVPWGNDGRPEVRVDHTPATNWRVIGLDSIEISQGHKDEATALKAMEKYLKDLNYVMPSAEDQAEELRKHEARVATAEAANKMRREARKTARG